MWSVARLALIWIMAAVLPLQGASAAAMQACGMRFDPAAGAEPTTHMHDENRMAAGDSHRHHAREAVQANAAAGSFHAEKTHCGDASGHKCSVCASCCLGAVLSSRPVLLESPELRDDYRPFITGILAVFLTQGIERPPRIVFA